MKNQGNLAFITKTTFITASCCLTIGIFGLEDALNYVRLKNSSLTVISGISLPVFIPIIFGLGWWLEKYTENLAISKRWNIDKFIMPGALLLLISGVVSLSTSVFSLFTSGGFFQSIMITSVYMFTCGYLFRFSALRSETGARLQAGN